MGLGKGPGDNMNSVPKMTLGGTAIKPIERHGMDSIRWFLYNKDTGAILGRTPKSWALITAFYSVYYVFLALFWIVMLLIFFQTIDDSSPKWIAGDGMIGTSPGLGVRPKQTDAHIDSSLIRFNKDQKEDVKGIDGYGGWVERASEFLDSYRTNPSNRSNEIESFDVDRILGPCARGDFGYSAGQPCVFLKLNKIYGLKNEAYSDPDDVPEDMPEDVIANIRRQKDKNQVWVHCRGENPADLEMLGNIVYRPTSRGFPDKYFPYMGQDNYRSPLVAVQFINPKIGQLLHVECRAWAKNIRYNRMDRIGLAHFELMILDQKHADIIGSDHE